MLSQRSQEKLPNEHNKKKFLGFKPEFNPHFPRLVPRGKQDEIPDHSQINNLVLAWGLFELHTLGLESLFQLKSYNRVQGLLYCLYWVIKSSKCGQAKLRRRWFCFLTSGPYPSLILLLSGFDLLVLSVDPILVIFSTYESFSLLPLFFPRRSVCFTWHIFFHNSLSYSMSCDYCLCTTFCHLS